jgi:hypothetical protein
MTYTCRTEKEVANAIKEEADTIEIIGDMKNGVLRIKATGKVAWGVCAACLAIAIAAYLATPPAAAVTGGPAGFAFAFAGTAAAAVPASILGSAIVPAIVIGISAGGVGALTSLRDKYKIIEKSEDHIVLKRTK